MEVFDLGGADVGRVPEWPDAPARAVAITTKAPEIGVTFVFGVNPRLPFDGAYRAFLSQVVERTRAAITRNEAIRARARIEAERTNLLLQAPVATAVLTGPRHTFQLANPLYRALVGRDVV